MLLGKIKKCYKNDFYEVKYQVPGTKIFASEHFRVDDIADQPEKKSDPNSKMT